MTPEKERSSRTVCVKRAAWGLALSARGAKSATAMRGLSTPRPVPVRNQSWAAAGRDKRESVRTERISEARFLLGKIASREFLAERNSLGQIEREKGKDLTQRAQRRVVWGSSAF